MTDWQITQGDSADVLQGIEGCSIDLLATDPPYGWDFMGKGWDKVLPDPSIWRECLRVLKPGAAACVMSGPRLDCLWRVCRDLEDAGFELEQTSFTWVYRSGFPKGQDFSKMADRRAGAEREVVGKKKFNPRDKESYVRHGEKNWSGGWDEDGGGEQPDITSPATPLASALAGQFSRGKVKPAFELIIWARKPISEPTEFDNVVKWGTGAVNCGACMVPYEEGGGYEYQRCGGNPGWHEREMNRPAASDPAGRFPANILCQDNALGEGSRYFDIDAWAEQHGLAEEGWAEAAEAGMLQVPKASRREKQAGLDGLPKGQVIGGGGTNNTPDDVCGKYGSIKAKQTNFHPTCKPVRLFAYLISLLAPTEGRVLDPFCGSGSTGVAAIQCGRSFIGVEMESAYVTIADARCQWAEENMPEPPQQLSLEEQPE